MRSIYKHCSTWIQYSNILANEVLAKVIPYSRKNLTLAVWQSAFATAKLKSAKISYSHIYIWQSLTEPPN